MPEGGVGTSAHQKERVKRGCEAGMRFQNINRNVSRDRGGGTVNANGPSVRTSLGSLAIDRSLSSISSSQHDLHGCMKQCTQVEWLYNEILLCVEYKKHIVFPPICWHQWLYSIRSCSTTSGMVEPLEATWPLPFITLFCTGLPRVTGKISSSSRFAAKCVSVLSACLWRVLSLLPKGGDNLS